MICAAIEARCLLHFEYDGFARCVAPYCHGRTKRGEEVLRAIQISGSSRSGGFGYGKLWMLAKMVKVRAGDKFEADDPNYNPNDSALGEIHCRV